MYEHYDCLEGVGEGEGKGVGEQACHDPDFDLA